ncbi:MAG: hypothetical protein HC941_29495 [Microcoleus sp. SU_5_3]|nr:hypothetical protein [Microcoleus sp. SU_5_3]
MSQTTLTEVSLDPILERLTQLTQLEADWDSYGALPVSPVAFVKACQLLIDVKYSLSPLVGDRAFSQVGIGRAISLSLNAAKL